MSYETTNYLPRGISVRQAVEFALLLGYEKNGTYAHLGSPETLSLICRDKKDYRSWVTVELLIAVNEEKGCVYVSTRTRVGRSHYDFEMQNRTVREFKKRFGGGAFRDGGNGAGYDPGPPLPPAASGCYLAMQSLDWNLSRVNHYLHLSFKRPSLPEGMEKAEEIWPQIRQLNPDVFVANVMITYLVSAMEDYLKSTYIALLTYSERKATVLKGIRLSGEQLSQISEGKLGVEEAAAEVLSFQRLAAVGRNFHELDTSLDILGPLKRSYRRRKINLLDRLEGLVTQRHNLIHGMEIDTWIDHAVLQRHIDDFAAGMKLVYQHVGKHYGWPLELPISSNF